MNQADLRINRKNLVVDYEVHYPEIVIDKVYDDESDPYTPTDLERIEIIEQLSRMVDWGEEEDKYNEDLIAQRADEWEDG